MSRWFRHYAGMMRDEKLVSAAVKSKQPVERVVWVWGAILESASEIDDAGRYELDPAEVAYFLRADEADVVAVIQALAAANRVADGVVVKWGDRQYQSDKSAERQARYRERKQGKDRNSDVRDVTSDGDVTSRDGAVTPQETEADTDTERKFPPNPQGGEAGDLFDQVEQVFPRSPHYNQAKAERAWRKLSPADQRVLLSKAKSYGNWWKAHQASRGRSEAEALAYAPPLDKWISEGAWRSFEAASFPSQPSPDLVVLAQDDPLIKAIESARGKPLIFGTKGTATVTKAEVERARAAA